MTTIKIKSNAAFIIIIIEIDKYINLKLIIKLYLLYILQIQNKIRFSIRIVYN
jgi:hypothetical protein